MIANKEVTRLENSSVKLTVTVGRKDLKAEYDNLLQEYSKSVQIKGFRKGKVPVAVLERKFSEGLREEASHNVMEKSLQEVFAEIEEKPLPYSVPEIQDELKFDLDDDFTFTVVYDIFPEVKVGDYKGVEIEAPRVKIKPEDTDRELSALQEQNSVVIDKEEGAVESGNIVTIDYRELDENGAVKEGTSREGFVFTVGSGYNLYRIDDDVIGMKNGEEKTIEKDYPADSELQELAGKHVKLYVKVTAIKEKKLPEINDELAQDISEKYATLDDLKADISKRLEESSASRIREMKINSLLEKIAETSLMDVPKSMLDMELENAWRNFLGRLRANEEQVLQLLTAQGKSREALYEEWKPGVLKNIKNQLVIEKISELEKIEASDSDVDADLEKQAADNNMKLEDIRDYYTRNNMTSYLKNEVKQRKVFDFLLENAKVKKGKEYNFVDLMKGNQ